MLVQKTRFLSALIAALTCLGLRTIASAESLLPGQIHDYPSDKSASSQNQHQLRFKFPNDQVARIEFRSEEFFAIILQSGPKCSLTNDDRAQIQELFPENKVFMDLFGCDDYIEENITYTNINADYSFIAVFGGFSFEHANQLFKQHDLAAKFPGANIRKMQAVLVYS